MRRTPVSWHSCIIPQLSKHVSSTPSSALVPQAAERGWSTFRDSQSQIWYFHERQNAWFLTHMYYV